MSMIVGAVNAQRRKNAAFARDIEYLREMSADDGIMERMCEVENTLYVSECTEDYRDAAALLDDLSPDDDAAADAEIDRILDATEDLSFDEMIGI